MSAKEGPSRSTSYADDPTLYLYTSLTAASSHITTATSRLETILRGNRLDFKPVDLAADENARTLWRRRAGGKKLPGLVKFGTVIGNIDEVDEWNEQEILLEKIKNVPGRKPSLEDKLTETANVKPNPIAPSLKSVKNEKPAAPKPVPVPAEEINSKKHRRVLSDAEFEDLLNAAKADNPDAETIDALLRESERRKSIIDLKNAGKPTDKEPEQKNTVSQTPPTTIPAKPEPATIPADTTTTTTTAKAQEPNGLEHGKVGEKKEKEASVAETPKFKEVSDEEIARAQAAQAKNIAAASEAAAKKAKEQNRAKLLAAAGRSTAAVEEPKLKDAAETPVAVPEEKADDKKDDEVKVDAAKEESVKEDPVQVVDNGNADAVKVENEAEKKEETAAEKIENAEISTNADAKDEPASKVENIVVDPEQPKEADPAIIPPTEKENKIESDIPEKADTTAPLQAPAVKEEDNKQDFNQDKTEPPEPKVDETTEKQLENSAQDVTEAEIKAKEPKEDTAVPQAEDTSPSPAVPEVETKPEEQATPVVADKEDPAKEEPATKESAKEASVDEGDKEEKPKVEEVQELEPETSEVKSEMNKQTQPEEDQTATPATAAAAPEIEKANVEEEPAEKQDDVDVSLDELIRQHNLAAELAAQPIPEPPEEETVVAPIKEEPKTAPAPSVPQQPVKKEEPVAKSKQDEKDRNIPQRMSTVKSTKIPSELFTSSELNLDFNFDLDKISAHTSADKESHSYGSLRPTSRASSTRPYSTLIESKSEKEKDPGSHRLSFIPRHRHTRTSSSKFSGFGESRAAKRRTREFSQDETASMMTEPEGSRSFSLSAPSQQQSQSQYSVPTDKGTPGPRYSTEAPTTGAANDYFASSAAETTDKNNPPQLIVTSNGSTNEVPVAFSETRDLDLSLNIPEITTLPQRPASSTGVSPQVPGSAHSNSPEGATARKSSSRKRTKSLSIEPAQSSKEKGRKMLEGKKNTKKEGKSHCFCM